ncbi:MAG: hypothetical protein ACOVLB_03345 [Candidatus Nanopelagicus sp.]
MSSLTAYVDRKNAFAKLFGSKQLSLQDAADRQSIAYCIESELSPENLTCDGELSRAEVDARYNELKKVVKELQKLDPAVKFYEYN